MDDGSDIRDDIKVPEGDLGAEIQKKFEDGDTFSVTVISAMGTECAIATKTMPK